MSLVILNSAEFIADIKSDIAKALVGTARRFLASATRRAVTEYMGPKVTEAFARKNRNKTNKLRIVTQRLRQGAEFKVPNGTVDVVLKSMSSEGTATIHSDARGVSTDIVVKVPYANRWNAERFHYFDNAIEDTKAAIQAYFDNELDKVSRAN